MRKQNLGHLLQALLACSVCLLPTSGHGQSSAQVGKPGKPTLQASADLSARIVKSAMKVGGLPPAVGPDDSVLVISGKINMGTQNYHRVIVSTNGRVMWGPVVPAKEASIEAKGAWTAKGDEPGWIFGIPLGCKYEEFYEPQYRSKAAAGYRTFIIFRDTVSKPVCYAFFKAFESFSFGVYPFVFERASDKKPKEWDTSWGGTRTFKAGPLEPK